MEFIKLTRIENRGLLIIPLSEIKSIYKDHQGTNQDTIVSTKTEAFAVTNTVEEIADILGFNNEDYEPDDEYPDW